MRKLCRKTNAKRREIIISWEASFCTSSTHKQNSFQSTLMYSWTIINCIFQKVFILSGHERTNKYCMEKIFFLIKVFLIGRINTEIKCIWRVFVNKRKKSNKWRWWHKLYEIETGIGCLSSPEVDCEEFLR